MDRDFPEPCVCQNTPALPSVSTAFKVDATAFFYGIILMVLGHDFISSGVLSSNNMKFLIISSILDFSNMPLNKTS